MEGTHLTMGTEYEKRSSKTANDLNLMKVNVVALRYCLPRYLTSPKICFLIPQFGSDVGQLLRSFLLTNSNPIHVIRIIWTEKNPFLCDRPKLRPAATCC